MNSPLIFASLASFFLALIKLIAFMMTGSMIVLSSMFDSLVDTTVSLINHQVFKYARKEANVNYPFGRGGVEVVAAVFQGSVILVLAFYVMYESIIRLLTKYDHIEAQNLFLATSVMCFSAFGGLFIHKGLGYWDKKSDQRSLSVAADQGHYMSDVWMNLLGALGLVLVWYSKNPQIDAALGLLSSLFLIHVSYEVLSSSMKDILQESVEVETLQKIADIIMACDEKVLSVHRLRARRTGPSIFIDLHMKLPRQLSLNEAHKIEEKVHAKLTSSFKYSDVIIHLDPDNEKDDDLFEAKYKINERKNPLE